MHVSLAKVKRRKLGRFVASEEGGGGPPLLYTDRVRVSSWEEAVEDVEDIGAEACEAQCANWGCD